MGRYSKEYCDYFSHDRDMRNHRKVKAIRNKFGITGYGVWNMILELLTGSKGNKFIDSEAEIEIISGDFGISATEMREIVDYCIYLGLLRSGNGEIWSESLNDRLKPVFEKREAAKHKSEQQSRNGGKFTSNKTETVGISAPEKPQSKVKESKVNNKDSNSLNNPTDTNIVLAASLPPHKNKFSEKEILETFQKQTDLTKEEVLQESKLFTTKYHNQSITDLGKLVAKWVENYFDKKINQQKNNQNGKNGNDPINFKSQGREFYANRLSKKT